MTKEINTDPATYTKKAGCHHSLYEFFSFFWLFGWFSALPSWSASMSPCPEPRGETRRGWGDQ